MQREKAQSLQRELTVEWLSDVLVPILTQTSNVSIRILDWLVTNSKSQKVVLYYRQEKRRIFDVYHEYDDTLTTYGRKLFDPFRRGPRTHFMEKTRTVERWSSTRRPCPDRLLQVGGRQRGPGVLQEEREAIESDMHRAHDERNRRVAEEGKKNVAR